MAKRLGRLLLVLGAAALAWWWYNIPRTPEEMFRARCSGCHEVPDVCRYPAPLRSGIVDRMRREKGAAESIDDAEATVIARYLREDLECP